MSRPSLTQCVWEREICWRPFRPSIISMAELFACLRAGSVPVLMKGWNNETFLPPAVSWNVSNVVQKTEASGQGAVTFTCRNLHTMHLLDFSLDGKRGSKMQSLCKNEPWNLCGQLKCEATLQSYYKKAACWEYFVLYSFCYVGAAWQCVWFRFKSNSNCFDHLRNGFASSCMCWFLIGSTGGGRGSGGSAPFYCPLCIPTK